MKTAKIFKNGQSQAVRLPKEFRFDTDEVYIKREGDSVVLTPKRKLFKEFFEGGYEMSPDFFEIMENRHKYDVPQRERESFD